MVADLPQEIIDKIIDEIALDPSSETRHITRDLKSFSLISSKWHHRSSAHLFQALEITSDNFPIWCGNVRPGRHGPSPFVTYLRYKPSWPEAERCTGPSEALTSNPSHISAFTNLRTLHFVDISLQHIEYLTCFGKLVATVRELWLEECQMDTSQFVSFVRPFASLEHLRLMRPHCPNESKLRHWDTARPPHLNGTLEYHQPDIAASKHLASFMQEFSLLPASFHTIVFRARLETPTEASRLLAASHRTLTKLTFGHNTIPQGINLNSLDALKELELSTLIIGVLPRVLRTIKSGSLERIRFFLLVHQLEDGVDHLSRKLWTRLDIELCSLANRVQAARGYSGGDLQVKVFDSTPDTPAWSVEDVARVYFPKSYKHHYISFSVG